MEDDDAGRSLTRADAVSKAADGTDEALRVDGVTQLVAKVSHVHVHDVFELVTVGGPHDAEQYGRHGSPSILVDGVDSVR